MSKPESLNSNVFGFNSCYVFKRSRMSDATKPEPHPFERLKDAMKQILTVPKAEILRREAEYRKQRKESRRKNSNDVQRD